MKLIAGLLLLVATALAYPVAENVEAPKPAVITDLSLDKGQQDQQPQESAESSSAESSESSEKPNLEASPVVEENKSDESSQQSNSQEKAEPEKPKQEEKIEAKPQEEPPKEEKKDLLEAKPAEQLAALKAAEPAVKSSLEGKVETPQEVQPAVKSALSDPLPETPAVIEPLALPTSEKDEKLQETPSKAAATETKEETALPSEQKVEVSPAAEEKLPEIKPAENLPAQTNIEHIEDRKDLSAPPAAEIKQDSEKKAKSDESPKLEGQSSDEQKPAVQQPAQEKPAEEQATQQKKAEGQPLNLPEKPAEEPKPVEAAKPEDQKAEESASASSEEPQEKLPEPSASSS